jgi:hypothetical protein
MKTLKTSILVIVTIFINLMTLLSLPPDWEIVDIRYDINDGYTDSYYTRIKCADSNNCFIWCNYHAAGGYYFRRTTDGGNSWKNVYMDSSYVISQDEYKFYPDINEIAYPNEKLFIAVGDSGVIIRTTDKGESWEKFRLDSNSTLYSLRMLDEKYGVMFTAEYQSLISLHMLETNDGGSTWEEMNFVYDGKRSIETIKVISKKQLAVFSWNLEIYPDVLELKLIKAYNNWEYCDTLDVPLRCRLIDFVDENHGWIAGGHYSLNDPTTEKFTQEIYYTSDGGKNWIEQRNRPYEKYKGYVISGLDMYDENFGVAESNHAMVFITTDGGKNWQENQLVNIDPKSGSSYPISSICAASPTTAYAILQGDTVYKYTREISNVNEDDYYMANLHPNPATSHITLSLGEEFISEPEIEIIDYLGNAINPDYEINGSEININTSSLSPGVFFLRVRSGEKMEVRKFVVVR